VKPGDGGQTRRRQSTTSKKQTMLGECLVY
jgi:hypothetical protein